MIGYFLLPLAVIVGWVLRWVYGKMNLSSVEQQIIQRLAQAEREAEGLRKDRLLEGREELQKERNQQEREYRAQQQEMQQTSKRLLQKEENLEKRQDTLELQKEAIEKREEVVTQREVELEKLEASCGQKLEEIAHLTEGEAKEQIIQRVEADARRDAQGILHKIEQETKEKSDRIAREIVVSSVQRVATDVTADISVTTVTLPSDDMKGRIIGREGRNIRVLEMLTGVDAIIDDTPEAVVISCFDPVRRAIAANTLERLIQDGRIHPARIEEVVQKVTKDLNRIMAEEAEKVFFDLGVTMKPEATRIFGRLYYRTSYGQNILKHSKEVALLAAMIAGEVGADKEIVKRGALFHDLGKAVTAETDATHVEIGVELAKKWGEDPRVINAIASHHGDVEPNCVESIIVQIADAISAARPGARRETLSSYIKRIEDLESISAGFKGVEKAFAVQAGRELRILVNNEQISEVEATVLAREIAQKIEDQMNYPGRIRVTIIRETRVVEYAR